MAVENRKQILIIAGAVVAGILATVLTSNYVKNTINQQTQALAQDFNAKQKEMAERIKERSDQQMAALAQELQKDKAQQAQAMQQQMQTLLKLQQQANAAKQNNALPTPRQVPLAAQTPMGKRAVTVQINSLSAVGGLISPGDFVDVIAQLKVPNGSKGTGKSITAMIFQDLQVLAVNTNIVQPGSYAQQQSAAALKITFAVDPQEAGLLTFADKNGTLELALRAPDEKEHEKVKASTWKTLADYVLKNQGPDLGGEEVTSQGGNKPAIQIYRGGKEL